MTEATSCAHLNVEHRTEPVDEPKGAVRGLWQCTMCSQKFWPIAAKNRERSQDMSGGLMCENYHEVGHCEECAAEGAKWTR